MPGGDRSGPAGMGPMTGRAAGYCAGNPVPGYMNAGAPVNPAARGYFGAAGRGMGMAWGRGFGGGHAGGMGMAWRRGWRRERIGGYYGAPGYYNQRYF
jgi:hypothetical protein